MGMEGYPAFILIKKEGKRKRERGGEEREEEGRGNKVSYFMDIILFIM